jgi:hypothetical protein
MSPGVLIWFESDFSFVLIASEIMTPVFITGVSEGVPLQAQNQDQEIRPVEVPAYHEFFRFFKDSFLSFSTSYWDRLCD